ncbi:hypothetical protein J6590_061302 [Homalodisca vitripennis]|nr:hypothetical protein J6590_061302 [Homalodisca vitripennis]
MVAHSPGKLGRHELQISISLQPHRLAPDYYTLIYSSAKAVQVFPQTAINDAKIK